MDKGRPPGRLRHSWEARCRCVSLMLGGLSPQAASRACGVSRATAYRLLRRFDEGGWDALRDRSSTPRRQPRRLSREAEAEIVAIRQQTHAGPVVIGVITHRPPSTVGKVLRRWGCSRLPRPVRDPIRRYERERPGELVHVDTKKLGRFHVVGKRILKDDVKRSRYAGWQHLHVAIDDHTRLAYTEVLPGQDKHACAAFLRRAVAWYATQGITVERVLSDNAKAYHSHLWRDTCHHLGVARRYTRPYTPRTNGKAEALIKTMLREWAYRYAYPTSSHRSRALAGWTRWYNRHRPHGSLGGTPPISRVSHLRGQYI
ncbi:MAG TPA: IS481 family transposase [Gaiellales bacterium]|nr:IS481 family transposase [Gaiellales bacterium]